MADPQAEFGRALQEVLAHFGLRVVGRPDQLRGALSDTLGPAAGQHAAQLDAVVTASREGVAEQIHQAPAASPEQVREWFDQLVAAGVGLRDAALATRSWADALGASDTARITSEVSAQLLGPGQDAADTGGISRLQTETSRPNADESDLTVEGPHPAEHSAPTSTVDEAVDVPLPDQDDGTAGRRPGAPRRLILVAGIAVLAVAVVTVVAVVLMMPHGVRTSLSASEVTALVWTSAELESMIEPPAAAEWLGESSDSAVWDGDDPGCDRALARDPAGGDKVASMGNRHPEDIGGGEDAGIFNSATSYADVPTASEALASMHAPFGCIAVSVGTIADPGGDEQPWLADLTEDSTMIGDMAVLRTRLHAAGSESVLDYWYERNCYAIVNAVLCYTFDGYGSEGGLVPAWRTPDRVAALDSFVLSRLPDDVRESLAASS